MLVTKDRLHDLVSDPLHRVERIHRALEDERDLTPPDCLHFMLAFLEQVLAAKEHPPSNQRPLRQQTRDRECRGRLTTAGFPGNTESFAWFQRKAHSPNRLDQAGSRRVADGELFEFEQRHVSAASAWG
jgi:hypothetical protein